MRLGLRLGLGRGLRRTTDYKLQYVGVPFERARVREEADDLLGRAELLAGRRELLTRVGANESARNVATFLQRHAAGAGACRGGSKLWLVT